MSIHYRQLIIALLRSNDHEADAADLERLVAEIDKPNLRDAALTQLRYRCQVRWLGERSIREVDSRGWRKLLDAWLRYEEQNSAESG